MENRLAVASHREAISEWEATMLSGAQSAHDVSEKVVDKAVIMEANTELNLCSCESDVVDETCSLGGDDAC